MNILSAKNEQLDDKKIAVLLSGGVDSSVVVYEMARQGLHPDCFYIKIGPEEQEEWDCSSEEDLEMATAVARRYGCNLEVVDCHQEYWDEVTRYTMDKVRAGFTPNPDVMCNRLIKFGAFNAKMGHNYDLIATGHYAQTEIADGHKWLVTSPDPVKDQTDFLAQIYDWQLRKALFPIGHYMKEEVRAIAEREHLINAKRKDSQGICFLGKINYNDYIRRYLGECPGDVLELETGKKIGQHKGLWFHTIGQRHGLGFGGGPWYAVKKDMERNILYVERTAYRHRQDGNNEDVKEHAHSIDVYDLSRRKLHEQRRHKGREKSGSTGHAHRESHIAMAQIAHDVARHAAGTTAHKQYAEGKGGVKVPHMHKDISHAGHDYKLRTRSYEDVEGATGKNLKVVGGERQAHCEHDNAKDDGLRCAAHPVEGVRQEKGHHGNADDEQ